MDKEVEFSYEREVMVLDGEVVVLDGEVVMLDGKVEEAIILKAPEFKYRKSQGKSK